MNVSTTAARRRILRGVGFAGTIALAAAVVGSASAGATTAPKAPAAPLAPAAPAAAPAADPGALATFRDSLAGESGKLRARFVGHQRGRFAVDVLQRLFGDSALDRPGIYTVSDSAVAGAFSFITLLPFSAKRRGHIGSYYIGNWPYERRLARSDAYEDPDGFIQVTPENQDTYVSEHFQLRDFLTHDQRDVWPKYLVLDERLVDKLELVIQELDHRGVHVEHMVVMSGFRTPEYNRQGVGRGRVRDSRHQYGDAADVFVDNNGDGRMDDLNHDGRVDTRDAKVIRDAVDSVEAMHPELIGGVGIYRATRAHGPFAHIDARGSRARWG